MMRDHVGMRALSPAHFAGFTAILLSAILFMFQPLWAAIPLTFYILGCAIASFSPQSRFFLSVVSRGSTGRRVIALTFDDGPDPLTTPFLLKVLSKYKMRATFFVSGQSASNYPDLIREILSDGHFIGNHSYSHDPFLMLYPYHKLYQEIDAAQDILKKFGILPLAFRPPVGLTNPKLRPILTTLGMFCVTFSCRAFDRGNRHIGELARKILGKVKSDDIVLLHDVRPDGENGVQQWLHEIELILSGFLTMGFNVIPLDELIGKSVMKTMD